MKKLLSLFLGFTMLIAHTPAKAIKYSDGEVMHILFIGEISLGLLFGIATLHLSDHISKNMTQAENDWNGFLAREEGGFLGKAIRNNLEKMGQKEYLKKMHQGKIARRVAYALYGTLSAALIAHGFYKIFTLYQLQKNI
jgi:hypothetical protein